MFSNIAETAEAFGFAEMMAENERPLKVSYSVEETLHSRDWGHENDFQFDDENEYGDDMPF